MTPRGTPLTPADYAALERRWIDRALADAAMLRRVDNFEGRDIVGGRAGGGRYEGISIPYVWPGEERIRDYRLRRDHPELEDGKPKRKYLAPPGRGNMLYFPPHINTTGLEDVELQVVITEGEFKALALYRAACLAKPEATDLPRFLPVALPGVWNWQGVIGKTTDETGTRVDEKGPIADLSRLEWSGRSVIIVFDVDVRKNESVQRAREGLTRELQKRGAKVRWFVWPKKIPEGVKGVDDFLAAKGRAERVLELIEDSSLPRPQRYAEADDGSSRKFICDDTGVWAEPSSRESKLRFISNPLWIEARTADYHGNDWGTLVSFLDPLGKMKRLIISNADLLGDKNDAIQRLVALGFKPRYDPASLKLLREYIASGEPDNFITCVNRVGWHGDVFVLPERTIGQTERQFLFQCEAGGHKYKQSGTLAEWQSDIARLCSGNTRLVFLVSCAFAAPLMELVKCSGQCVHVHGISSCGKTTAVLVAGSAVGGDGERGYIETWRTTANALEIRMPLYNDMILPLDEITEGDVRTLGSSVYMLGNGAGKTRANRDLSIRPTIHFRTVALSTGERGLAGVLADASQAVKGGQEARMIDIEADAGQGLGLFEKLHGHDTPDRFATTLQTNSRKYYGTAIIAFLEHLTTSRPALISRVQRTREDFFKACVIPGSAGEVSRVASFFGLVAAAGEEASREGITGWRAGESYDAAKRLFDEWVRNRGGIGAHDVRAGIRAVVAFLQSNEYRFQNLAPNALVVRDRAGFFDDDDGTRIYYVFPHVFEREICGSYDHKSIAKALAKLGFLKQQNSPHFKIHKRLPGYTKAPRMYAILSNIFNHEEAAEDLPAPSFREDTVGTRAKAASN